MRIAYLHCMSDPGSQRGGPGVHIQSSVAALESLGHTVRVVGPTLDATRAPVSPHRRRSRAREAAAGYAYVPRALLRTPGRARTSLAALAGFAPDVVLARYEAFEGAPLLVARALRVPLVWEVNGTASEIPQWNPRLVLYPGTGALERWALAAADGLFAVSEELRRELVGQGLDAERITVIPNGADPDRFRPRAEGDAAAIPLPADAVVVGFLGSFSAWHDVATITAIVPPLLAAHPRVHVVLAGADPAALPETFRRWLPEAGGRVHLPGLIPIADAPRWMARFDVALSLYPKLEPFYFSPVKLFEYMACGSAVVATAIGQQETVITSGENGLLAPPADAAAVLRQVTTLVGDAGLRRRLGAAARETIVRGYTWRHNAERIAALCEAVVARRAAGTAPVAARSESAG
jgi:glycosyltransferase involved in cell wall biosynthesis